MIPSFIPLKDTITSLIQQVVATPSVHGLWLNTLSYLENCGARKIASCQHPTTVKEEMLKHASEEFRHAFYLKTQLSRIDQPHEDYSLSRLLGGWAAYHYLTLLDLQTCRYLCALGVSRAQIQHLAYLLVTYAIELRAGELYPVYQAALKQHSSKVQVRSILLEEQEHLQEMERALKLVPRSEDYIQVVCHMEAAACDRWLQACHQRLVNF